LGTVAILKLDKVLRLGVLTASVYLDGAVTGWAGLAFMVGASRDFY